MIKLALLSVFFFSALSADDVICKKCQVIREYNEAHPENNYYWYDDYLKDQKTKDSNAGTAETPKVACSKCPCDKAVVCNKCPDPSTVHACGCGKKKKNPNNA